MQMNQENSHIVVVIPAYNEEKHIGEVIRKCKKYAGKIIVVDDCSTDNTRDVALSNGVFCVTQPRNIGWGFAVQTGIELCRYKDIDIIITIDGDGQHNPDDMLAIINEMRESQSSLVIGSRFKNNGHGIGNIPAYRKLGIDIINLIYNFGRKNKLTDTQSGFRAHRNDASLYIKIEENGFALSTERLIKSDKLGFKISEVAISSIYHKDFSENSSINPIIHGLQVALKTLIWRIRVEILMEKTFE